MTYIAKRSKKPAIAAVLSLGALSSEIIGLLENDAISRLRGTIPGEFNQSLNHSNDAPFQQSTAFELQFTCCIRDPTGSIVQPAKYLIRFVASPTHIDLH